MLVQCNVSQLGSNEVVSLEVIGFIDDRFFRVRREREGGRRREGGDRREEERGRGQEGRGEREGTGGRRREGGEGGNGKEEDRVLIIVILG